MGQNKNNYMIQYLVYQVLKGLNTRVEMAHLHIGHTKFHPDTHFGKFELRWRKSAANTLKDVCEITSKCKNFNVVLVADEKGHIYITTYNWVSYFKKRNASQLKGLHNLHKFFTSSADPGFIFYQKSSSVSDE